MTPEHEIPAEVHTDDYHYEVAFDALPWFEQASDQEIIALARCGWGGDYEADEVAEFCADHNAQVARLFDYLSHGPRMGRDSVGFECRVDNNAALVWIKTNRPALSDKLPDDDEGNEIGTE
jgi:hypothetical protein